MDIQTMRDMETMAEWQATQEAYRRFVERRARRKRSLRFWFNPHQVAAPPTVAVPTSEGPAPPRPSGVGTGVAGSADTPVHGNNRLPGDPHL